VPWHRRPPSTNTGAPFEKNENKKFPKLLIITLNVFVTTLTYCTYHDSQCTTYHYSWPTLKSTTAWKCLVVYTFYDCRDSVDGFTFTAMNTWPWCIIKCRVDRIAVLCVLTKCQKFHFRWAGICICIDVNFKIFSRGKPPNPHWGGAKTRPRPTPSISH